jgi:hypothetical protein
MSSCIDRIYKQLMRPHDTKLGGTAFLSLEEAEVSLTSLTPNESRVC